MLKHYSFLLKKTTCQKLKESTFLYKILRISDYMKEQTKKKIKALFSNPATVKNVFPPGWAPCSSRVHHCLLSRAVEESPKRKTPKNGVTSELLTHSHCPCPSAEAATSAALQKCKEKQGQQSSTQILLSKCQIQTLMVRQMANRFLEQPMRSWVWRIHLITGYISNPPRKLRRLNKVLPFLINMLNCNSWEALKQVVWRAVWISYFVFQSITRWKDLQRSFQAVMHLQWDCLQLNVTCLSEARDVACLCAGHWREKLLS